MLPRAFAVCLVCLAGCGKIKEGGERSRSLNALKALSIDYLRHQDFTGQPPASADDLAVKARNRNETLNAKPDELAKLTVQWGAKLDPRGPDAGTQVLAWMPAVGGEVPVLMQDGSVKTLPEAEFAAAPKASPPGEATPTGPAVAPPPREVNRKK